MSYASLQIGRKFHHVEKQTHFSFLEIVFIYSPQHSREKWFNTGVFRAYFIWNHCSQWRVPWAPRCLTAVTQWPCKWTATMAPTRPPSITWTTLTWAPWRFVEVEEKRFFYWILWLFLSLAIFSGPIRGIRIDRGRRHWHIWTSVQSRSIHFSVVVYICYCCKCEMVRWPFAYLCFTIILPYFQKGSTHTDRPTGGHQGDGSVRGWNRGDQTGDKCSAQGKIRLTQSSSLLDFVLWYVLSVSLWSRRCADHAFGLCWYMHSIACVSFYYSSVTFEIDD